MAIHDYVLANQSGSSFRSDLNNALAAIVSSNSSATEPTTTYAYQYWIDTSASPAIIKQRNATNDAWFEVRRVGSTGKFDDGTEALPSIAFNNDTDTGLYRPADNEIGISTNGVEGIRLSSAGYLGVGTTAGRKLHVSDSNESPVLLETSVGSCNIRLVNLNSSTGANQPKFGTTGDEFIFTSVGSERMRIDSSGNVGINTNNPGKVLDVNGEIRASTGILFGTDTAAANTLDDYEEGTWTPTYFGATTAGSYTATTSAAYTKVGNLVTVSASLVNITTVSAGTGGLRIGGLPFAASTSASVGSVIMSEFNVLNTTVSLSVRTTSATTSLRVLETPDGAVASQASVTDKQTNTAYIRLTITYEV